MFEISSFKFQGEGRRREWSRQEQKSDSNHFRDVVRREGKKVIQITFLVWRKEQKSDSNHFCDLAHREEIKEIHITFFRLGTKNKKVIQITFATW